MVSAYSPCARRVNDSQLSRLARNSARSCNASQTSDGASGIRNALFSSMTTSPRNASTAGSGSLIDTVDARCVKREIALYLPDLVERLFIGPHRVLDQAVLGAQVEVRRVALERAVGRMRR